MATPDLGRYGGTSSGAYTPNMKRPDKPRSGKRRALAVVALSILLPPVGLIYMWRTGIFTVRGRVLLSALSALCLSLMCTPLMPKASPLDVTAPIPVVPAAVTQAPENDVVTALSNIEELLAAQQAAAVGEGEPAPAQDPEATTGPSEEEILSTIVYSVRSGAKYYHTGPTCGTQKNARELTVEQALAEQLAACPDCNPPAL